MLVLLVIPVGAQSAPLSIAYGRSWPRSIAIDATDGLVYVDGVSGIYPTTGFSFGIVNATTHTLARVFPLNVTAGDLALDPKSGNVFVGGADSIVEFDASSQSFTKVMSLGIPVFSLAYDSATGYLFVTSGSEVYQVDPATGERLRNATVGPAAEGIAIDSASGRVYASSYLSSSVSVFDAATLDRVARIVLPSPCFPGDMAIDTSSRRIYTTTGTNGVDVIDTGTNEFVRSVLVAPLETNSTFALALDAEIGLLYVLANPGDRIQEVDLSSMSVRGTLTLASAAYEMEVDPASGELYVSVYHDLAVFAPQASGPNVFWQVALPVVSAGGALVAAGALLWRRRGRGTRAIKSEPERSKAP